MRWTTFLTLATVALTFTLFGLGTAVIAMFVVGPVAAWWAVGQLAAGAIAGAIVTVCATDRRP